MIKKNKTCALYIAFLNICTLCIISFPAIAQEKTKSDILWSDIPKLGKKSYSKEIADKNKPENLLKYSSIIMRINADTGMIYNDNIYRSASGEESDLITFLKPELSIISNFEKHAFNLYAKPDLGIYISDSRNDYLDFNIGGNYRLDISDNDQIDLGTSYAHKHMSIGSFIDDPDNNLKKPVVYDNHQIGMNWNGRANIWHYSFGGIWNAYDYDNTSRQKGTVSIQDDRDYDNYKLQAQIGYEFVPFHEIYVRAVHDIRDYDTRIDSSELYPRDSDGYLVAVGISNKNSSFSSYDYNAYIGYLSQDYDATQLPSVKAVDLYLDSKWQVTEKNLLKAEIMRRVKDSTSDGVSAYLQSKMHLKLTHDYNENISFGGRVSYTNNNFETNKAIENLDRDDDIYELGIWSRHEIYNNTDLKFEYSYLDRDSNSPTASYNTNKFGITLSFKY